MLVLTMHPDRTAEDIIIRVGSEVITIRLCSVGRDKARVGVQAARHVEVNRREVDERKFPDDSVVLADDVMPDIHTCPTPLVVREEDRG